MIKVVCALLKIADGYVFVHEKGYEDKLVKCPGGRTENRGLEEELMRELFEELGINIEREDIKNHFDVQKKDYEMRFFNVKAEYIKSEELKKGEEIEFIRMLPDRKALEIAICFKKDIVPCHENAVTELLNS